MTSQPRKQNWKGESSSSTDSYASSAQELDVRQLRDLISNVRESLALLCEFTDGMVEELYDIIHIRLNNLEITTDLVEIRIRQVIGQQVNQLPGRPPRTTL